MDSRIIAYVAAGLHAAFVIGEMVPLSGGVPFLLKSVMKKRGITFDDPTQRKLVSTIVQNAGIYNLIMSAGFLFAASPSLSSFNVGEEATNAIRAFFFSGAIIAGLFGLTLSKMTIVQAAVGLAGLWTVLG